MKKNNDPAEWSNLRPNLLLWAKRIIHGKTKTPEQMLAMCKKAIDRAPIELAQEEERRQKELEERERNIAKRAEYKSNHNHLVLTKEELRLLRSVLHPDAINSLTPEKMTQVAQMINQKAEEGDPSLKNPFANWRTD